MHSSSPVSKTLTQPFSLQRRCMAWMIHALTASGAYVGLLALVAIYDHRYNTAFWLMGLGILIDAVDGMFARLVGVKTVVPQVDGALLDNIVDFFTYTIIPAFFLLVTAMLPEGYRYSCVMIIIFSSAFQFSQVDAKTSDHFFKGFPSYWNIAVFYLYFWQMNAWMNLSILLFLAVLSFVPIKYVYPSRLDFLTHNQFLRWGMVFATAAWFLATAGLLWIYPETNQFLVFISMGYLILYFALSLYRTWVPLSVL